MGVNKDIMSMLLIQILWIQMAYAQCNINILETVVLNSDPKHLVGDELFEYDITLNIKPIKDRPELRKTTNMNILLGSKVYVNRSEYVNLFADTIQMFSVVKNSKMILWQDFEKETTEMFSPSILFKQIDSLACKPKTENGKSLTLVTCFLKGNYRDQEKIDHVEYLLDQTLNRLYSAKVFYNKESGLASIEMVYKSIRKVPCPEYLKGNIRDVVFERGKKVLKATYKGYQLADHRKKSNLKDIKK